MDRLADVLPAFCPAFLRGLGAKGEIVVVMDGSQTSSANTTLMLSVLYRSFAISLTWVVKKGEKDHCPEEMYMDLLRMIAHIYPTVSGCRLVLLGDGEFDVEGLRQWCTDNQRVFVVRTSSDRLLDFDGEVARFDSLQNTRSSCFLKGGNA